MVGIAKRYHIHLETYHSIRDLAQPDHPCFDVAIVDDGIGQLARKQLGKLLTEAVPVLTISTAEGSTPLQKDLPQSFKKSIDKNVGPKTVLEEALALVGARHFLEES